MIDATTREQVLAQLWSWLPGVYRARDTEGRLAALLALYGDELWRIRRTVERRHGDLFIDSAQDWVIAYLADLVGTDLLYTGAAAALPQIAARNRQDVKNTLHWRRRKGTLAGLEGVARDAGGFGVHAVEMFERLAWTQNLAHIKPAAVLSLDLSRGEALAATLTPFSRARALVDLRPADHRAGWHLASRIAAFEWPIDSFPLADVVPRALGGGRYTFHPLGLPVPLHAGGATEALRDEVAARAGAKGADICHPNADDTPIRTRDLAAHPAAYVDSPLGFAIREDGIALVGGAPSASPSLAPALDFGDLADARGMAASDTTVFAAGARFALRAVRLGAVFHVLDGTPAPVPYSPGRALASQLQLSDPQGSLALDAAAADFSYVAGNAAYEPASGPFHHPALLLGLSNTGAAPAPFPESELILRNARGLALQAYLPALAALAPGGELFLYAAEDGSTYFARGDHGAGEPDRNPDASLFGAFSSQHLARASEGQRRIRPGHPPGAGRWRRLVARSLCCWDRPLVPPLAAGEVAVDPERGRVMFPAGEAPAGELSVDFRYPLTAPIGAGPFARAPGPPALHTVARRRDADFAAIQSAIDAAPDGGALPVVIEILDSALYEEAIVIDNRSFPGGLVIRAAPLQTPCIVMPAAAAAALRVSNSAMAGLALEGLVFAGGAIEVSGGVPEVSLRHCTLQPATARLEVTSTAQVAVRLDACISGPVRIGAPEGEFGAADTILQEPRATVEQPAGFAALGFAGGAASLLRCTLVGDLAVARASISDTLCYGNLELADPAGSCLRFSRLPKGFAGRAFGCTSATPIFVSLAWGDAGYLHLHPNTAATLTAGGEEGGEIGAYNRAGLPWRVQNAGRRLSEYVPAALAPVQVPVLPRSKFLGNPRP